MKKFLKRFSSFVLCVCLMVSFVCMVKASDGGAKVTPAQKKVLLIIASKDYEDNELFDPMTLLQANGAKVSVASITTAVAIGSQGRKITPDVEIASVKAADYDAFAVIGGTGVIGELWENLDLRTLLQQANEQNKIIAAICAAPPVLAKAGLLKDKNATMFPWDDGIAQLTSNGAKYVDEEVVVDGNIITGKNPAAAKNFGLALCDAVKIRKFQKNVLMVIAPKDYEDCEFTTPKTLLEVNGAKVTVASTTTLATGTNGSKYNTDILISDAVARNYDAIVVVGGTGVISNLWEDKDLRKLLQDANKQKKVIAAICAAPPALAKAGILKHKKATMYPWNDGIKELTKNGARYVNQEVVVDGNIITGRNPDASIAFGLKLCEVLKILGR